jgi:hypothetical protein
MSKSKIKMMMKIISAVLLIPGFIYTLFLYLKEDSVNAWFWATVVGIGNTMLFFSSPNRKITEGIKELGPFDWMIIIFFSLVPFFLLIEDNIFIRIVKSLCAFVGFVGCLVFQHRIMALLRKDDRGRPLTRDKH